MKIECKIKSELVKVRFMKSYSYLGQIVLFWHEQIEYKIYQETTLFGNTTVGKAHFHVKLVAHIGLFINLYCLL